ncbi:MAG: hypothetical protein IMF16_07620, partial [Proteobacteria bacterium]|nr:hypothetical protein [Pseudomonadota bacterium]
MKTKSRLDWRSRRRGFFTLIGLLAAMVIMAILVVLYLGGPGGRGGPAGGTRTTPGAAKESAQSVVCANNLTQLRTAIDIYQGMHGSYPRSLEELETGIELT